MLYSPYQTPELESDANLYISVVTSKIRKERHLHWVPCAGKRPFKSVSKVRLRKYEPTSHQSAVTSFPVSLYCLCPLVCNPLGGWGGEESSKLYSLLQRGVVKAHWGQWQEDRNGSLKISWCHWIIVLHNSSFLVFNQVSLGFIVVMLPRHLLPETGSGMIKKAIFSRNQNKTESPRLLGLFSALALNGLFSWNVDMWARARMVPRTPRLMKCQLMDGWWVPMNLL